MVNSYMVMLVIRSSRPVFRNNHDKVAFVVHASFIASGFRLVAIGRPAFAEDALASSPTQGEVGIQGWNEFDEYAFVYAISWKGLKKVLVKCLAIDDKLLVDAIAEDGIEPAHLEIQVGNYVGESRVEGDYHAQFKNLSKLVTDLQNQIMYKIDEGLERVTYVTQSTWERIEEDACVFPGFLGSLPTTPGQPPLGFNALFTDKHGFMGPPQPGVPPSGFVPGWIRRQPPKSPGDSQE